eukprot:TRINITY_DN4834_c0_g2_i1.p1 TRINITY_DN4834_c0_g2~~TRINITY_DN4834_c0_g2_i1.p1  ORF type:complete len:1129 (+),score=261.38 TRINITY_DN4834_c0_g2_i1:38-3424(+)
METGELTAESVQLGRIIGSGGFGEVYEGKYHGIKVAVKRINTPQRREEEEAKHGETLGPLGEFRREALILSQLRHPFIISFYGCVRLEGAVGLVLEWADAGSVRGLLDSRFRTGLAPPLWCHLAHQTAAALAYLYQRTPPVAHRDVKSDNVLLVSVPPDSFTVKLADFGLSRLRSVPGSSSSSRSSANHLTANASLGFDATSGAHGGQQNLSTNPSTAAIVVGTLPYQAPECVVITEFTPKRQLMHLGEKSDVYSYAILLWEMLTGLYPHEGKSPAAIIDAIWKHRRLPLPDRAHKLVKQTIESAWVTNPHLRPSFQTLHRTIEYIRETVVSAHQTQDTQEHSQESQLYDGTDLGVQNLDVTAFQATLIQEQTDRHPQNGGNQAGQNTDPSQRVSVSPTNLIASILAQNQIAWEVIDFFRVNKITELEFVEMSKEDLQQIPDMSPEPLEQILKIQVHLQSLPRPASTSSHSKAAAGLSKMPPANTQQTTAKTQTQPQAKPKAEERQVSSSKQVTQSHRSVIKSSIATMDVPPDAEVKIRASQTGRFNSVVAPMGRIHQDFEDKEGQEESAPSTTSPTTSPAASPATTVTPKPSTPTPPPPTTSPTTPSNPVASKVRKDSSPVETSGLSGLTMANPDADGSTFIPSNHVTPEESKLSPDGLLYLSWESVIEENAARAQACLFYITEQTTDYLLAYLTSRAVICYKAEVIRTPRDRDAYEQYTTKIKSASPPNQQNALHKLEEAEAKWKKDPTPALYFATTLLADFYIIFDMHLDKVISIYQKAADEGVIHGKYSLGRCYYHGVGCKPDHTLAFRHFLDAANLGHVDSMRIVANFYRQGLGTAKSNKEAKEWLYRAAEHQSPHGQHNLGVSLITGDLGEEDDITAAHWFSRAAERGVPQAQHKIGTYYFQGIHFEKNLKKAVHWYKLAADQGLKESMGALGFCYMCGAGVKKNPKTAFKHFLMAAMQGHTYSMTQVGRCYYRGEGIEKDVALAIEYLEKAAEAGSVISMNLLSEIYFTGESVKKDPALSAKWMKRAAEAGDAHSLNNYGVILENGRGIPKDLPHARAMYQKAADLESPAGTRNLGIMYLKGLGGPKDTNKAHELLSKAAYLGDELARERLDTMQSSCCLS